MGGLVFNLVDTAGLRESGDFIEAEGVRRSYSKIENADIVLNVIDLTQNKGSAIKNKFDDIATDKTITVYNKLDVAKPPTSGELSISALTGENMDELQRKIVDKARSLIQRDEASDLCVTSERHRACLLKSCEYLVNARKLVQEGAGNELISFEIREALSALGEIIGRTTNVDILNNIFSRFCIGK
jgi:tRNA modification GTPase